MRKSSFFLALAPILFAMVVVGQPNSVFSQSSTASITGYIWSDTVGWVDLHCSNTNSCATNNFGFSINPAGTITGLAWSDNIGWISANVADLIGCPSGTCSAWIVGSSTGGWLRAISGGGTQSGGWDGFISLSGVGYGATLESGDFSGYFWGSTNFGWVDTQFAHTNWTQCDIINYCIDLSRWQGDPTNAACPQTQVLPSCTYGCSNGTCLPPPNPEIPAIGNSSFRAVPPLVRTGDRTRIRWTSQFADACTVTGNGDSWTALNSPTTGYQTNPILNQVTYSLTCSNQTGTTSAQLMVNIVPGWFEK